MTKEQLYKMFFKNDKRGWDDIMFLQNLAKNEGKGIAVLFLTKELQKIAPSWRPSWRQMLIFLNYDFQKQSNAKQIAEKILDIILSTNENNQNNGVI